MLRKALLLAYNSVMKIGIIGGSGVYNLDGLSGKEERVLDTPYGQPSGPLVECELEGRDIVFLARHGKDHAIPPHKINYRANISAMKQLGVVRILSIGAVGGIREEWRPGTIVVPDQVLDMTMGARPGTFFDGGKVMHIDFTDPYCPQLRRILAERIEPLGDQASAGGTYICTNGPRLESAAEIRFFGRIGADIVGMTAMPEAALAREAELCYASICIVTNPAAGLSGTKLTTSEVMAAMKAASGRLHQILREAILAIPDSRNCPCSTSLRSAAV